MWLTCLKSLGVEMLTPLCVGVLLPRSSSSHWTNEGRFETFETGLNIGGLGSEEEESESIR